MSKPIRQSFANGKLQLYQRNGIYYARVYIGGRRYIHRSAKTTNYEEACEFGNRLYYRTVDKLEANLPVTIVTMARVIDEYIAMRTAENKRENKKAMSKHSKGIATSDAMLRQINRVAKFWYAFCGKIAIDKIDNEKLKEFIIWRKEYYHKMLPNKRPRNAKLNPADKTLQFEMAMGKAFINYAHEKGYRGKTQLPTYSYVAERKISRPSFTYTDYRTMLRALANWKKQDVKPEHKHIRIILYEYVLILSNSGMRVGEANKLKWQDIEKFKDERGRDNYRIFVKGKTGKRTVIPRIAAYVYFNRLKEMYPDRAPTDYIFRMYKGNEVITLIDQFNKALAFGKITKNKDGQKYALYSLRHSYAMKMLQDGMPIFDIAKNMGTSVEVIQQYYGKHATADTFATRLGG